MGLVDSISSTISNALSGATRLNTLGWTDTRGLNRGFFVTLYPVIPLDSSVTMPPDMMTTQVVAKLLSDDDTVNVNWESSLEGTSAEKKFSEQLVANAQSGILEQYTKTGYLKGRTLLNRRESLQIFKGVEAQEKNLLLEFIAYKNAYLEVEAPFQFLKKMASPQLSDGITDAIAKNLGQDVDKIAKATKDAIGVIPFEVALLVGGKRISPNNYVIASVSSDRDSIQIDRNGNQIYRQVNVVLKSKQALMRDDIKVYGII
jgi:hypothetical protein